MSESEAKTQNKNKTYTSNVLHINEDRRLISLQLSSPLLAFESSTTQILHINPLIDMKNWPRLLLSISKSKNRVHKMKTFYLAIFAGQLRLCFFFRFCCFYLIEPVSKFTNITKLDCSLAGSRWWWMRKKRSGKSNKKLLTSHLSASLRRRRLTYCSISRCERWGRGQRREVDRLEEILQMNCSKLIWHFLLICSIFYHIRFDTNSSSSFEANKSSTISMEN